MQSVQSEASATHLLYSGRTEAWSLISRSFTWFRMANFQLSSTWVRFEHILASVCSARDRNWFSHDLKRWRILSSTNTSGFKCFWNVTFMVIIYRLWKTERDGTSSLTFRVPTWCFLFPFLSSTYWDHAEKDQKPLHPHVHCLTKAEIQYSISWETRKPLTPADKVRISLLCIYI